MRGDADTIFYIKDFGDRDKIIKLQLHGELQDKIVKTEVFESNARLVAFEQDVDYRESKQKKVVKQFYIFTRNAIAKTVRQREHSHKYVTVAESDFSGHELFDLAQRDWSHVHMSHSAITKGDTVFKAN